MALKLKIGSPVAGDDFFGRNAELKKAETLIEDNNLMLAAPRRVGKTSFAKRLMEVQNSKVMDCYRLVLSIHGMSV